MDRDFLLSPVEAGIVSWVDPRRSRVDPRREPLRDDPVPGDTLWLARRSGCSEDARRDVRRSCPIPAGVNVSRPPNVLPRDVVRAPLASRPPRCE